MKLQDLIDIEAQLLQDSERDPSELRQRDRTIGLAIAAEGKSREALFLDWLRRVRPQGASIGARFVAGLRWLRLALILAGLATGVTAAQSTLAYDGSTPVNVVHFIAIFAGVQMLTLLFLLLGFLPAGVRRLRPLVGELRQIVRELSYLFVRWSDRFFSSGRESSSFFADLQRLRARHVLYYPVERWLVLGLTQRFGIAFNFGALVSCLYLVAFSDLAFAWNTTLQLSAQTFHRIVSWLAAPWALLVPDAVPNLALVEATRYFRIDGEYLGAVAGRAQDVSLLGGWWPFLIMTILAYGLIPRLLMLGVAHIFLNRQLHSLPLHAAEFNALYDRLTRPLLQTRATTPEAEQTSSPANTGQREASPMPAGDCLLVFWGERSLEETALTPVLQRRFGLQPRSSYMAGGYDARQDETVLQEIAAQKGSLPVVVLAESWEVPDKAIIFFLKEIRRQTQPQREIILMLFDARDGTPLPPASADFQIWKRTLAEVADPWLRVEALVDE